MKVAIVTRFPADPLSPRGGVEAVSVNLVRALAEIKGMEIHVVTTDPHCVTPASGRWKGVTIHRLRQSGKMLPFAVGRGRRDVKRLIVALNPDVIHAHDVYGLMVKGLRIPRVFTIHGFIHADTRLSDHRFPRLRAQLWKRVELAGWADQPHIISISPYVRERLSGVCKGRIHDIDNPISEQFFDVVRHERKGRIFTAAWVSPRKNTLALVRAYAHLKQMGIASELHLAGAANQDDYFEKVRQCIRDHHIGGSVKMLGCIPQKEICRELSRASAFVLVSLEENSPLGVEEAMAAGVPVITSDRCGMPYMVSHGETGFLVDPTNPQDIVRRMQQLLGNDELRRSMSDRARQIARDRFHPAVVARRTYQVYQEAIYDHRYRTTFTGIAS